VLLRGRLLQSTFPRYGAYLKAARQFTSSQGAIVETTSAASEIDRVLTDCITSVGPQAHMAV